MLAGRDVDRPPELLSYDRPGNVRELRHTLEHACVMSSAEVLDVSDLELPRPAADGVSHAVDELNLATAVAQTERRVISRALDLATGNRAHASRLLGIRRALLYARMRDLGLATAGDERE